VQERGYRYQDNMIFSDEKDKEIIKDGLKCILHFDVNLSSMVEAQVRCALRAITRVYSLIFLIYTHCESHFPHLHSLRG
jgi:hypothetical protein